VTELVK